MQLTDLTNFLGFTDTKSKEPEPADNPSFDLDKLGEKKSLYKWKAPLRAPLKGFQGKLKKNFIVIAVVIGFFLLLIGEIWLILVFASIAFIGYILAATPSPEVEYEITTHGIDYVDQFYYWSDLGEFFLTHEGELPILNINVREQIPARLFLTLKKGEEDKVVELCNKYLPYLKEAPESFLDKSFKKITDKLDL